MAIVKSMKARLQFGSNLSSLDIEKTHTVARKSMTLHFLDLQRRGATGAARGPEEFYGFAVEDVAEMYFYKHGTGPGVWYRLNDGRVIDLFAKPSEPEPQWYTSGAH